MSVELLTLAETDSDVTFFQGTPVADLLKFLLEMTGYKDHLEKTQDDFRARWENVQELVNRCDDLFQLHNN
jgi:superfamily I DNA/RNA helicase